MLGDGGGGGFNKRGNCVTHGLSKSRVSSRAVKSSLLQGAKGNKLGQIFFFFLRCLKAMERSLCFAVADGRKSL